MRIFLTPVIPCFSFIFQDSMSQIKRFHSRNDAFSVIILKEQKRCAGKISYGNNMISFPAYDVNTDIII